MRGLIERLLVEGGYYKLTSRVGIEEIARRWRENWEKAYDDSMPVKYPLKEIWPYREYTWTRAKARRSTEEWDELKDSMKKSGWNDDDPLLLNIGQDGGIKVGEGNHRLAIAKEIGIRSIPVRIIFYTGKVKKTKMPKKPSRNPARRRGAEKKVQLGREKPMTDKEKADQDKSVSDIMKMMGF